MKAWQHVTIGVFFGAVVASTASFLLYKGSARPEMASLEPEMFNGVIHQAIAVRARNSMESLEYLDRGDTESARQRMSAMLRLDAQVLGRYANDEVLGMRTIGGVDPQLNALIIDVRDKLSSYVSTLQ